MTIEVAEIAARAVLRKLRLVLMVLKHQLRSIVRLCVFYSDPVLPLNLHVPHDVRTALLAPLNLLKLRMQVETLLYKLLCRQGHVLLLLFLVD